MKTIERYSIGTGDRFGRQGAAQIAAVRKAREKGVDVAIVWNKSNREHILTGIEPADQGAAAERAIQETGWDGPWYVDADHIGLATVDRFAPHCDFFTLDVADFIGKSAAPEAIEAFVAKHANLPAAKGMPARLDAAAIRAAAGRYLHAVDEAAKTYRRICELRKGDDFVTEVSMDETAIPQSPAELIVILAALADAGIPVQTIAPKFSGRFNKGVDYVGDIAAFFKEFEADVRVAALRHVQADKRFDPGMRQLVHVAFRVAAAMGGRYFEALDRHEAAVSRNVTANLWERHLVPLFIG